MTAPAQSNRAVLSATLVSLVLFAGASPLSSSPAPRRPRSSPSDLPSLTLLNEKPATAKLDRSVARRTVDAFPKLITSVLRSAHSGEAPASARVAVSTGSYERADGRNILAHRLAASKFAVERLRFWQEHLGFLSWDISLQIVSGSA